MIALLMIVPALGLALAFHIPQKLPSKCILRHNHLSHSFAINYIFALSHITPCLYRQNSYSSRTAFGTLSRTVFGT